nr:hypothetical protein [Siccibacter turicensis]
MLAGFRVVVAGFLVFTFRGDNLKSCACTGRTPGITITAGIDHFLIADNILLAQLIDGLLRFFTFCRVLAVEFQLRQLKLCLFRHAQEVILNLKSRDTL